MGVIEKEVIKAYALDNAISHNGKAVQGSIISSLFSEGLKKEEVKDIVPLIAEVLKEVNSMALDDQKKKFEKMKDKVHKRKVRKEGELPELPEAKEREVVMRLAPFPSGPLHIGNTRAAILNDEFVKKYKGKFILFFDDTIGSEIKQIEPEAYKLIEEGINWLGIKPHKVYYKSDRTSTYYDYAEEMIKKGYMYVCDCPQEDFQRVKEKGIECPCRHLPFETHMKRWKEMFLKETPTGKYVVRLKTSMQDPDPAFRDRVMMKISERTHPKTKDKYRVYPSMEFSWAIDDYLIGTTHILRGIEHQMSTRVQDFIRSIFGWKNPVSLFNGLLQIEGVKISKSKGSKEVNAGTYFGWNDPRLWSLQSLRDRGIKPEAIREFILSMGLNKSNATVPIDVLYSINKKYLEKVPRYFFVADPVKITIKGCPELEAKIPLHPTEELGLRKYKTGQEFLVTRVDFESFDNGNYRLMHLLNFKAFEISLAKPKDFSFISEENDKELHCKMVQWLPTSEDNLKVKIVMEDGSFIEGLGEPALKKLKEGAEIQFERFGFVKLHRKEKDFYEFWFAHK